MTKHTEGPWFVTKKFEVGPRSDVDDQSNGMVIPVADVFGDNKEADASLIGAAPDLLEALQLIQGLDFRFENTNADAEVKRRALAAIKKATA